MTTWRPIPGYEGLYEVSDEGQVRSWQPYNGQPVPRLLRTPLDSHGYPSTALCRQGLHRTRRVHVLVGLAFIGPRPDGLELRHLDGDKTNAWLRNLTYGTKSENSLDAVSHGSHPQASKESCPVGHPYEGDNLIVRPSGWRHCRTCRRDQWRRYARERKARLKAAA